MGIKKCLPVFVKKIDGKDYFLFRLEDEKVKSLIKKSIEKKGSYLMLNLDLPRGVRTVGAKSQNHAINGYAMQIATETGQDFWDVKTAAKMRAIKRGYPVRRNENGEIITSMLTGNPIPESEVKITTVEASYLIDELIMIASELGISLEG